MVPVTAPKSDAVMQQARVERAIKALLDEVTRMRHYKGFTAELKPLYERQLRKLNDEMRSWGGKPRRVEL
jgi:hypothetical protein